MIYKLSLICNKYTIAIEPSATLMVRSINQSQQTGRYRAITQIIRRNETAPTTTRVRKKDVKIKIKKSEERNRKEKRTGTLNTPAASERPTSCRETLVVYRTR